MYLSKSFNKLIDRHEKMLEELDLNESCSERDSLIILNRMFTEFLFIKNSFEIQTNSLQKDIELIEFKPCVLYVIDSYLSTR